MADVFLKENLFRLNAGRTSPAFIYAHSSHNLPFGCGGGEGGGIMTVQFVAHFSLSF